MPWRSACLCQMADVRSALWVWRQIPDHVENTKTGRAARRLWSPMPEPFVKPSATGITCSPTVFTLVTAQVSRATSWAYVLKHFGLCLFFPVVLHLTGCGSLPAKPQHAVDQTRTAAKDSFLSLLTAASLDQNAGSGFRLIPNAAHALDARLQLIRRAEQSVDVQYYYIAMDRSGREFLSELQAAAQRGVLVRLLVDDLHTAEVDALLLSLAATENFQVRLFNPFCCARTGLASRFIASLFDIGRLNRRMHNKLMVVDGVIAVVGGRNIADEYFSRNNEQEFLDLDLLLGGDIVSQLNAVFLRYWNSEPAWDAAAVSRPAVHPDTGIEDVRKPDQLDSPQVSGWLRPRDMLGQQPLTCEIAAGKIAFSPGAAYAFADMPGKVLEYDPDYLQESSVSVRVKNAFETARQEVVLSSPYFVPGATGMQTVENLAWQGVRMVVLTNSLATNDSVFAHAGYVRYRKRMLRLGVALYELRPFANIYANLSEGDEEGPEKQSPLAGRAAVLLSRLHAKTAVIDKETVYVGSMNLDPRSSQYNTELGLLIESVELSRKVLTVLETARQISAFKVQLSADGALTWTSPGQCSLTNVDGEPQASFGAWLQNVFLAPLIPESLL